MDQLSIFEQLGFYTTLYTVLDMGLMVWLLIYFLDVTNVVFFIARGNYAHLKRIPKIKRAKRFYELRENDDTKERLREYEIKSFVIPAEAGIQYY